MDGQIRRSWTAKPVMSPMPTGASPYNKFENTGNPRLQRGCSGARLPTTHKVMSALLKHLNVRGYRYVAARRTKTRHPASARVTGFRCETFSVRHQPWRFHLQWKKAEEENSVQREVYYKGKPKY